MTTVQDFIYKNTNSIWANKVSLDPDRCSYEVTEVSRVTSWHQCNRKPVEEVDGYSFCKTHARIVKQKLGIPQEMVTRYAASFEYGEPYIAEIQVVRETEHTIDIAEIKALIGDGGLYTGNQSKNSRYTRVFEFFDTGEEAYQWLLKRAENGVEFCKKELHKAEEIYSKLSRRGL